MRIIGLIIRREYLTRVKKKSFLIMTILGPLLMAALMVVPVFLANKTDELVTIEVIDEAGIDMKDQAKLHYERNDIAFADAKKRLSNDGFYAILYLPKSASIDGSGVVLYAAKEVSLTVKERIATAIEGQLYERQLTAHGLRRELLDSLHTEVAIRSVKATETGEEQGNTEVATIAGFIGGFLIYIFIFLYGMQVMRGVMEEKTNRIVEVIISSVRPFELMMGKIVGVALVGLTQFLLWVILTMGISTVASKTIQSMMQPESAPNGMATTALADPQAQAMLNSAAETDIMKMLGTLDLRLLIAVFIFYFLGGYLLYSALFAAVGAAVDSETDTQQFMLPITLPLILSFIIAQSVVTTNPDSPVAFWFSIIPFTAPVVMMVRLPFGVPGWQLALSMSLLVLGFICTTWFAAKIYRTGILLYGKKITYRELARWLFYKG